MKRVRNIIEIDESKCNGCGECVPACEEGAIEIRDGKAKVVADKLCDGLGACLGTCPTGALQVVQREAEAFDETAVEERLGKSEPAPEPAQGHGGCPGSQPRQFTRPEASSANPAVGGCPGARAMQFGEREASDEPAVAAQSELTHWPVQIRLMNPSAPYLANADLLVTADCVPVAYAGYHQELLKGKVALLGCPKFDDMPSYVEKFADIFTNNTVKSVTVAVMQVPCCQGLPIAVRQAADIAGADVPIEKVVVSLQGEILRREPLTAAAGA